MTKFDQACSTFSPKPTLLVVLEVLSLSEHSLGSAC